MSPTSRVPVGLTHQPLRAVVQDELRRAIIAGRYSPGERLFEDQIAHELDVSRNPVREALQALAVDGFVELEPRRGAKVATISNQLAEDLFEVRQAMEGLVARLAARRRSSQQLEALRENIRQGTAAVAEDNLQVLPELNTEFHRLLGEAAANGLLAAELDRLSHMIEWVYAIRVGQRSAGSWKEHEGIVDAIADQDEERALELAEDHIASARAAFFSEVAPIISRTGVRSPAPHPRRS